MIKTINTNGVEMDVVEFFDEEKFNCKRVFTLKNLPYCCERGNHAHKECTQIIHCVNGSALLNIWLYDNRKNTLSNYQRILKCTECITIEPMQWLTITSTDNYTDLIVYCNRNYNEDDYIRDFDTYVKEIKKIHNYNIIMLKEMDYINL